LPAALISDDCCVEGVDLVALMLEQACQDLLEGALPSQNLKLSFAGIASSWLSVRWAIRPVWPGFGWWPLSCAPG
jgi:hypothetical protein